MRRRPSVAKAVLAVFVTAVVLAFGFGAPARAETECSALAAADGVRTLVSTPGASPTDVDAQGPAAQAQVDSTAGSKGWAGLPFSNAAAGNVGAANVDATQVPVFAISESPARPSASTSTPAGSVESTSDAHASTAKASAGGPSSDSATIGSTAATAAASCSEASVKAEATDVAKAIDVGGVLRIASVTSRAIASVAGAGQRTLEGTIDVEGVTVAGQTVGIGDRGIVVGGTPTAVPANDNPLLQALDSAGIKVRTLGTTTNKTTGDVLGPALEITVTRAVPNVGTGPMSVTYTFGRAYARASGTPGGAVADAPTDGSADGFTAAPAVADGSAAAPSVDLPTTPAAAPAPGRRTRMGAVPIAVLPQERIANASQAGLYPPLAFGAVVFAAAWLVFRTMGVRLRWN